MHTIHSQHQIPSPSSIPLVLSPLMPTTWGDAFVVHDIGQVQPSWVNLFSASVTCNKSTLFFIKWLRDPGGWAEQRAELLSKRPAQPSTHISRHPFWEITGLAYFCTHKQTHAHIHTPVTDITHTHSPVFLQQVSAISFPQQRKPGWDVPKQCVVKIIIKDISDGLSWGKSIQQSVSDLFFSPYF